MRNSAMSLPEIEGAARLCVASLIGMSVGLEREWSGAGATLAAVSAATLFAL
jgi:uncharacterized membrane protein YhiD involved in acid resistance